MTFLSLVHFEFPECGAHLDCVAGVLNYSPRQNQYGKCGAMHLRVTVWDGSTGARIGCLTSMTTI